MSTAIHCRVTFPPDVEIVNLKVDEKGNPTSFDLVPRFYRPDAKPPIAFFETRAVKGKDEKVIERSAWAIAGSNGKVLREDRDKSVSPAVLKGLYPEPEPKDDKKS